MVLAITEGIDPKAKPSAASTAPLPAPPPITALPLKPKESAPDPSQYAKPVNIPFVLGDKGLSIDDAAACEIMKRLADKNFSFQVYEQRDGETHLRVFHNGKYVGSVQTEKSDHNPETGKLNVTALAKGLEQFSDQFLQNNLPQPLVILTGNPSKDNCYVSIDPKTTPEIHNTFSYLVAEYDLRYENGKCVGYDKQGHKAWECSPERRVVEMTNGDYLLPHATLRPEETRLEKGSILHGIIKECLEKGQAVLLQGTGNTGEPLMLECFKDNEMNFRIYLKSGIIVTRDGTYSVPSTSDGVSIHLSSRYDKQIIDGVEQAIKRGDTINLTVDNQKEPGGKVTVTAVDAAGKTTFEYNGQIGPITSARLSWSKSPEGKQLKESYKNLEHVAELLEEGAKTGKDLSREIGRAFIGTDALKIVSECKVALGRELIAKHRITPFLGGFIMPNGENIEDGANFESKRKELTAQYGQPIVDMLDTYAMSQVVIDGLSQIGITSFTGAAGRPEYYRAHGEGLRQVLDQYARILAAKRIVQVK